MEEIDQDALKRQEIRRLRGFTLRMCVSGMNADGLRAVKILDAALPLYPDAGQRQIDEALTYLEAAGLVERNVTKRDLNDKLPVVKWKATAKGVNVLEGDVADRGVDVG